jgi:hypothetical protein
MVVIFWNTKKNLMMQNYFLFNGPSVIAIIINADIAQHFLPLNMIKIIPFKNLKEIILRS